MPGGPVSSYGNGWTLTSLDSLRAYIFSGHSRTWLEAEDFCQVRVNTSHWSRSIQILCSDWL